MAAAMGDAKGIVVRPVTARVAGELVRRVHYSRSTNSNSQLHLGVYYRGALEGAMQFGPSLDKRKSMALVRGTRWNGFLELNRMAFTDRLPRNSESRAMAIAFRMLRRHRPDVEWVLSFADGTQCGDGTIYRAAGFLLTGIKRNTQIWQAPTGERFARLSLTNKRLHGERQRAARALVQRAAGEGQSAAMTGKASMATYAAAGWRPLPGFQLRYVYFLNPAARERLTVPVLPYSAIREAAAGMYKGQRRDGGAASELRAGSIDSDAAADQAAEGGASPTPALQV